LNLFQNLFGFGVGQNQHPQIFDEAQAGVGDVW
jgi:hypothetical protein